MMLKRSLWLDLDGYIEDALIGDDDERPLAAEDLWLLRDVVALARIFVRLDHRARTDLLDVVHRRVAEAAPPRRPRLTKNAGQGTSA
jgi:hypothetical protein